MNSVTSAEARLLTVTIPLRPMAAPRMTQRSKWLPKNQEYLAWKEAVGLMLSMAMKGREPEWGPVTLRLRFVYKGRSPGDISNVLKAIEDAGNHIVWQDDRQVRRVEMEMVKGRNERIELEVEVLLHG